MHRAAYWSCPAYGACACDTACTSCKVSTFWVGRRLGLSSLHQYRSKAAAWAITLAADRNRCLHAGCCFVCKTRLRAKRTMLWLFWRCTCSALRCRGLLWHGGLPSFCLHVAPRAGSVELQSGSFKAALLRLVTARCILAVIRVLAF
jgi:hypothetical protein